MFKLKISPVPTPLKSLPLLLLMLCLTPATICRAWGPKGHAIVAQIAMQFVNANVKQNILQLLAGMPVDTAANWMDIVRSNADYDFMKPWHYIDFDKGKNYEPSTDENIVNRLIITYNELQHKKVLCTDQVRTDLLIVMHLMGDLHQPLHTGYADDLGGNRRAVQYEKLKTNLHHFWDEDIIDLANITAKDCIALNKTASLVTEPVDLVAYMISSRRLIDSVYNFADFTIDKAYVSKNTEVVKKQLLLAGLRLAAVLNKVLYTTAPAIDFKQAAARYKNGIEAKDAAKYIGKTVTVCSRVYGIKTTDKVTFINVGAAYPNSPLTLVIFAKDRSKFPASIDELYKDKNLCIKGDVVQYQGKAEIIVSDPDDIKIL